MTAGDTRTRAAALDAADPLRAFRDRFVITDPGVVYLDGNSLGRLPLATRDRLRDAVEREWGGELIRGWARWIGLAQEAGAALAGGVLEADPDELLVADSTSVNLYKLAAAALDHQRAAVTPDHHQRAAAACDARPPRRVIVTDDDNFPTDGYVLQGLAAARGAELRVIKSDVDLGVGRADVRAALDDSVALVSLSHVAYRSGAIADLAGITADAHDAGALVLWDLSHSAGAVPVPLRSAGVDLAVGCTYKHLNAGPGAPAFLYVRRDLHTRLRQPIWGWFGQRDQFAMGAAYDPVDTIERFQVGTPPVLGLYSVVEGVRLTAAAGIDAIAAKGRELTRYAVELADEWLAPLGFALASPRDPAARGSHVTLCHPEAWQACQALIEAGVVPDFRVPDRLRLGMAPLYTRFVDVHDGLARLRDVVASGRHLAFPAALGRVT